MLVAVPLSDVTAAWVSALPLMSKIADSAPDLTLSALWQTVSGGEGELWLAGDEDAGHQAAAITRLKPWGGGTAAYVVGAASFDGRLWREVIPAWHAALKARGADLVVAEGRPGWERVWPGAKVVRKVYEVAL